MGIFMERFYVPVTFLGTVDEPGNKARISLGDFFGSFTYLYVSLQSPFYFLFFHLLLSKLPPPQSYYSYLKFIYKISIL